MPLANEAIAGCAAGVVGTIFGYPLDVLKTRMQTSQSSLSSTIRTIAQENGIKGFYAGLMSPLLALTILNTMNFTAYNHMCHVFQVRGDGSEDARFLRSLLVGNYALAGASVGPLAAMISTPFEFVKTQVQLQRKLQTSTSTSTVTATTVASKPPVVQKGSLQMSISIVREHGILALYRGHVVNTLREMVFLGTYFMVYEHGKLLLQSLPIFQQGRRSQFVKTQTASSSSLAVPIAGGIAGAIGWAISFPLDNVKSHIQSAPLTTSSSTAAPSKSITGILQKIWRDKGLRGLYSGVLPSVTRAFIVSATRFSVYETVIDWLRVREE